jgi:hypothetical protein
LFHTTQIHLHQKIVYVLVFHYIKGWKSHDDPIDEVNMIQIMGIYLDKIIALVDCINTNLELHEETFDDIFET